MDLTDEFLAATIDAYQANKRLAERAQEQVAEEKLFVPLDDNTNSIAVIMKHVAGNLTSRWTNFLSSDGEKPDRNRDDEFVNTFRTRAETLECWERGWSRLFEALKSLRAEDFSKTVFIRGEPHSVFLAIQRNLGHACYHVGQIVLVARFHAGEDWTTLTIPRGESERFTQANWGVGPKP